MNRPGDWNCRSCQHLNFQRRDSCQRCGDPRPGDRGDYGSFGRRGGSFGFTGPDVRSGDWYCSVGNCGAHNYASRSCCFRCGALKDEFGFDSKISWARGFGFGDRSGWKTEQTLNPSEVHDVLQDQDAGTMLTSAGTSLPAVEMHKKNDAVISAISPADLNSASIQDDQSEQQSAVEITEEGMILEDSETKLPRSSIEQESGQHTLNENVPVSESDFDSQQAVESASYGEIQVVHEMRALIGAESVSGEQKETESTSSKIERSKHHEESILSPITTDFVLEKEHYLVIVEDYHIKLKLDHQTILVGDCPSLAPPESSPVNVVLNLAEQDLRELSEKPDHPNSLLLFLQRNERLTLIQSSFFDKMPDLRFLDFSDTRIRILPSSLFRLSKLKVLMLRNCVCLEKLPSEIENLNPMEVLDLSGTELYNLPDEIGQLTLLRHMKLSFYGPDDESEYDHLPSQLVSPSFLSELKELQALNITVHPDDHRWTKIAARIIEDVGKLEMLSYLQFYFPEVEIFEHFIQTSPSWNNHKLSKFNFILGHNVKRIVSRVPDEVESLFDQQDNCLRFVNGDKVTQVIKTVLFPGLLGYGYCEPGSRPFFTY